MLRFERSFAFAGMAALITATGLAARQSDGCVANENSTLGIGGIECRNCRLGSSWAFGSEPKVLSVVGNGPAAGRLQPGDVIVSVDGLLITTREGGARLRRPEAGRAADLRVRRDGREVGVSIVPARACSDDEQVGSGVGRSRGVTITTGRVPPLDSVHITGSGVAAFPSEQGEVTLPSMLPKGWMGLSFRCTRPESGESVGCRSHSVRDSLVSWSFASPPEVVAVEPSGPAGLAGLRGGDLIVSIDGLSITSDEGGRRFAGVAPGDRITIGYQRGNRERSVGMVAARRPGPSGQGTSIGMTASTGETYSVGTVRYSGRLGDTMIEVTGEPVTVSQDPDQVIIRSSSITVRLRRAGSGRSR